MVRGQVIVGRAVALLACGLALLAACGSDAVDTAASCSNHTKDNGEEGRDCGGVCPARCSGSACDTDDNCASKSCKDHACAAPTGKTCGVGTATPTCADGQDCELDKDCTSGFCDGAKCASPKPESHTDGQKNAGETGIDCGGSVKADKPCPEGQGCIDDTDCAGACTNSVCGSMGPQDGKKDNGETDVDCGGPNAPKCADGKTCQADGDCATTYCKADTKVCTPPRPDDGVKNADETDVDCGGTVAPKCAVDKSCKKHEDCASDGCSYANKCVEHRSCTPHHGGDTCGPENAQGDCCETLAVARPDAQGGAYNLDKYVVTAGRMRAFVERTNGNIRDWIQQNRPTWFSANWDKYLPTTLDDPDDGNTGLKGVYQQLGPYKLVSVGGQEPANRGCNVEGPGARTYWVPDDINNRWQDRQRYPKDDLDEKALNCVTQYVISAFCAWDGGRLPTIAEISYAYTGGEGRTYPWGNSPAQQGYTDAYDSAQVAPAPPANSHYANHGYNWWSPAQRIDNDYTVYIAPPGRFPDGNGKFGQSDLAHLVLEWASDRPDASTGKFFWNGSWEVAHPTKNSSQNLAALAKYYAIGARCARD
jgi:hypothetical protein